MPSISDPRVIKFVNEQIRPLCEQVRATKARIVAMQNDWNATIAVLVPNDSSPLADGRDAEGVSRLTGADINQEVTNLIAVGAAANDQIIGKACVRALSTG